TIHYHLKNLPSNFKVKKSGNKSLIDDNTLDYLERILNRKKTKESSDFYEKSTNEKKTTKDQYRNYIDKYIEHLESEIRQNKQKKKNRLIVKKKRQMKKRQRKTNRENILTNM